MDTLQTPEFVWGESALAWAVLEQAEKDASNPRDNYERNSARCFLCGSPSVWRGSLNFWCALANIPPEFIMYQARKKWKPNLLKGRK